MVLIKKKDVYPILKFIFLKKQNLFLLKDFHLNFA